MIMRGMETCHPVCPRAELSWHSFLIGPCSSFPCGVPPHGLLSWPVFFRFLLGLSPVWYPLLPTTRVLGLARLLRILSWIVPRVVSLSPHHTGSCLFSPNFYYVPHRIIFKTFLKIPTPVRALKNFPCELQHLWHCGKLVIYKAMYALSTYAFCLRNLSKFNEIGSFATNWTSINHEKSN